MKGTLLNREDFETLAELIEDKLFERGLLISKERTNSGAYNTIMEVMGDYVSDIATEEAENRALNKIPSEHFNEELNQ